MSLNQIIIYVMALFMLIGTVDKCIGNKFGLGEKFEEGIMTMGSLALSMIGMICLAPVLADLFEPVVVPLFNFLGADPGIFAGCILANDMGGAQLAVELAKDPQAGAYGGLLIGATMGVTIVFTIPASLGIIQKEDRKYMALGVLAGIITIPIGAFFGGLAAGYSLNMVLHNLTPIIIFAVIIAVGLLKFQNIMIKLFVYFGNIISVVIAAGFALAILESLTGIVIIPGMAPIDGAIETVGQIAIVLAGAFPLIAVITKLFNKLLANAGKIMGINDVAVAGLIASLANSIPMFGMVKDMDSKGKILNFAFAVSAAFVFGDHLGFTAGFNPDMITPMIVTKLVAGVTAVGLALLISNRVLKDENLDSSESEISKVVE